MVAMSPSRSTSAPLSTALLKTVRAQLQEGERLAWAASPEPAAFERESKARGKWDAAVILGGGYATLAACVVAFRTEQWLWLFVPLVVVLIGGVMLLLASRLKARARRTLEGTVYGLTTRRALIVQTYPAFNLRSLPIDSITDVTLSNARDEFADLCLQTAAGPAELEFRGLPDAERTRTQLLRVVREPQVVDQEIAAAEAFSMAMHQMRSRVTSQ
jgi:Bacterial PH domain